MFLGNSFIYNNFVHINKILMIALVMFNYLVLFIAAKLFCLANQNYNLANSVVLPVYFRSSFLQPLMSYK